eukprot:140991-Prorocentrum_minimum.AAC.2
MSTRICATAHPGEDSCVVVWERTDCVKTDNQPNPFRCKSQAQMDCKMLKKKEHFDHFFEQ